MVDQAMRKLSEEEICELRERVIARRRGDSFPNKESGVRMENPDLWSPHVLRISNSF